MSTSFLITGARILNPASGADFEGDLRIEDGFIAEIGTGLSAHEGDIVEAEGAILSPALIDMRARAVEPGGSGPESLDATLRAAASGGVGTLILSPASGSGIARPEDVDWVAARALTAPVRLLAAGLTHTVSGEMAEAGLMLRAGAAFIGEGHSQIADMRFLRNLLTYVSAFDAWVALRAEEPSFADGTIAHESSMSVRLGLPVRPGISERLGVERLAALAELTGARILLDRISTADGLEALKAARRRGLEIAASVPLTHLVFNEVDMGGLDPAFRLEPPLRSELDRSALLRALAEGVIEAIVSDHTPLPADQKANPFSDAPAGSANLEALIPALCTLDADGQLPLMAGLKALTIGPAELLGLSQGRIEEGAPADLILFDPSAPVIYGKEALQSRAPSAFAGRRLQGRVLKTWIEGAMVYAHTAE